MKASKKGEDTESLITNYKDLNEPQRLQLC